MHGFRRHLISSAPYIFRSLNTSTLMYMIPLGLTYSIRCQLFSSLSSNFPVIIFLSRQYTFLPYFCCACSAIVSNELGAGKPQHAKLAVRVVMCMAFFEGLVVSLTMVLLRHVWGYMYSDMQEVVSYIAKMLPILGISFFMDGLHSSLSGKFYN